jgi:hypothetical protein
VVGAAGEAGVVVGEVMSKGPAAEICRIGGSRPGFKS